MTCYNLELSEVAWTCVRGDFLEVVSDSEFY